MLKAIYFRLCCGLLLLPVEKLINKGRLHIKYLNKNHL